MAKRFSLGQLFKTFQPPRFARTPFLISYLISLASMLLVLVFYFRTQPVVPLFYTLPQAAQQLAAKEWLFIFPLVIALITAVHLSIVQTFQSYNRLLMQLFSWTTILIQIIFGLALVRIVTIII